MGSEDDLSYRFAVPADAHAVMAFWATAAEDSHRSPDSPEAVLRLIARTAAGYTPQPNWTRWVKPLH